MRTLSPPTSAPATPPAGVPAGLAVVGGAVCLSGSAVLVRLIHRGGSSLAPSTTAALLMVQPVLTLGLGSVVLGERPAPLQWIGAAIVLAALAVANRPVRSAAPRG